MKNIILSAIAGFAPAMAIAGGHADFAGHGTAVTTDSLHCFLLLRERGILIDHQNLVDT